MATVNLDSAEITDVLAGFKTIASSATFDFTGNASSTATRAAYVDFRSGTEVTGTGLTYDSTGKLVGGTITGIRVRDAASYGTVVKIIDVAGLSLPVATALAYAQQNDAQATAAALFSGPDTITINSDERSVPALGLDGDDTFIDKASTGGVVFTIDGGNGHDTAVFSFAFEQLSLAGGGSNATVSGHNHTVYANSVEALRFSDVSIDRNGATTTVSDTAGNTVLSAVTSGDVVLTDLTGNNSNRLTLSVVGSAAATVSAGTGHLVAMGGGATSVAAGSGSTVVGGAGTGIIAAAGNVLAYGGTGALTFIGQSGASTVIGGTGPATIFAGAGGGLFAGGSAGGNVLVGGTGAATLFGGGNTDALFATGAAGTVIVAGSGNETIQATTSTGNDVVFNGAGNDLVALGTGPSVVLAGTGNATVLAGSGPDLFAFTKGGAGGTEVIYGFKAGTDRIALVSYGSTEADRAVATATATPGSGTTITLSDNTRITFAGLSAVSRSMFL